MRISPRALALTLGVLWGGAMLIVGVAHAMIPSYGAGFFEVMGSVYPGIEGTGTAGDVVLGMVYGLVDGALGGLLIAWVYNFFLGRFDTAGSA